MLRKLKLALLKIIDVSALGFLEPYVRLAYGEEVQKQLQKIMRFTVVPLLVILAGILVWGGLISPNVKTKSGELPSPAVVVDSMGALHTFSVRESNKAKAYLADGEEREQWFDQVGAELEALAPKIEAANQGVIDAREKEAEAKETKIAPLQAKLDKLNDDYKTIRKQRQDELKAQGESLAVGDESARTAYLLTFADLEHWIGEQKDAISLIKDDIKAIRDEKDPGVTAALAEQTAVAEQEQYLKKMVELLGDDNREVKTGESSVKLEDLRAEFMQAEGAATYKMAKKVVSAEERLAKTADSDYAKPATLYYQIERSLLCVFTGFFVGSAIAIPIGVLCGLSKTFMGAVTPFIALFKPVSPIVWLPIFLIVASASIPDPDKHWFTQWLWEVPWIGEYKINPAFIASALTVAMCSLWATMVNTALGVASVDKDHINVARVLRLGFWSRLFKIVLPSSLPLVFAGLRISLGVGWMVLIAAELLSSSEGIGKFVWDQFNNGASDSFAKMMVVVFIVGIIGLLLDRIMVIFQRLVSFEGSVAAV